jgi:hypothetical protein
MHTVHLDLLLISCHQYATVLALLVLGAGWMQLQGWTTRTMAVHVPALKAGPSAVPTEGLAPKL